MTDAGRFEALSIEAKAVAVAWFSMMPPDHDSRLRFEMVENRPTAKAQKGLDELLSAGFIALRHDPRDSGAEYRPIKDMRDLAAPIAMLILEGRAPEGFDFQLVEPIAPRAPRRRRGKAAP